MNFLDMGIMEILMILLVALIIWGPGKIPEIARQLGKFMATMKKMSFDLTTQVKRELELEEKESRSSTAKNKTTTKNNTVDKPSGTSETSDAEKNTPDKNEE